MNYKIPDKIIANTLNCYNCLNMKKANLEKHKDGKEVFKCVKGCIQYAGYEVKDRIFKEGTKLKKGKFYSENTMYIQWDSAKICPGYDGHDDDKVVAKAKEKL